LRSQAAELSKGATAAVRALQLETELHTVLVCAPAFLIMGRSSIPPACADQAGNTTG
jgi:hypothetical protein